MRATIVGITVTLFWLVMMATLVRYYVLPHRREVKTTNIDPAALAKNWQDYEEVMKIQVRGQQVGYFWMTLEQSPKILTYLAKTRARFSVRLIEVVRQIDVATVAELDNDFTLNRFAVSIRGLLTSVTFKGSVYQDRLYYEIEQNEQVIRGYWPLEAPPSLLEAVQPLALRGIEMEVGQGYRIPVVDPIWRASLGDVVIYVAEKEKIRLGEREVDTFRIETTLGQMKTNSWVTPEGEILRWQIFGDLVMERTTREAISKWFQGGFVEPQLPEFDIKTLADFESEPQEKGPELGLLSFLEKVFPK